MEDLQNIRSVRMVHNLHIWSLTMGTAALSVHLAIGKLDSSPELCLILLKVMAYVCCLKMIARKRESKHCLHF